MNPPREYDAKHCPELQVIDRRRRQILSARRGECAHGRAKVQVLDHGRVVEERPWSDNLILDQGLNFICTTYNWAQAFLNCVVGTGVTPTFTDSVLITIDYNVTTPGGHATASAPFFTAGMVGELIQLDTGEQVYITGFNTNLDVSISSVAVVAAAPGTVWAVNQVGLAAETKRTNTYLVGAGNCGTTDVANLRTLRRTFDFSVEVAPQNYTELGWAQTAVPGNNLFSRIKIPGGAVAVLIGQSLRVIYDLAITVSPNVSTAGTYVVAGWPVLPSINTDGNYLTNNPFVSMCTVVAATGAATGNVAMDIFQITNNAWLSTTAVLPPFGNNYVQANEAGADVKTLAAYVAGSFVRQKQFTWNLGTGNRADWRAITFSNTALGASPNVWTFVFAQTQTKDNLHLLQLNIDTTVGRILINP